MRPRDGFSVLELIFVVAVLALFAGSAMLMTENIEQRVQSDVDEVGGDPGPHGGPRVVMGLDQGVGDDRPEGGDEACGRDERRRT